MLTDFSDFDLGLIFFEELHQTAALRIRRNCILILVMGAAHFHLPLERNQI